MLQTSKEISLDVLSITSKSHCHSFCTCKVRGEIIPPPPPLWHQKVKKKKKAGLDRVNSDGHNDDLTIVVVMSPDVYGGRDGGGDGGGGERGDLFAKDDNS